MKVIPVFCFICFLTIYAFAQQRAAVSGRVIHDGRPENEALVALISRRNSKISYNTTADKDGNFRFENIPAGDYNVSSGGAGNSMRAVSVIASVNVTLNAGENRVVTLELAAYPIRETVTVAAGESQILEQVSKTIDVISAQEMRERADFSLAESLRTIPGFRVSQLGGFGRTATIKTRGLRNQDTAILIDGIRFRDASSITGDSSPFLSDITLTSVNRVEILRGSGSSLYGTNAIGGTVNFQTPRAATGTHGQIGGAFGGYGLRRFRGNISRATGNGKFGINAGGSRTVYAKGIDGQDDAGNTNFQSRVDASPFQNTSISGRIFVSDANVRLNSSPDTFGALPASSATIINANPGVNFVADANDPDSLQRSKFFSGQLVFEQMVNSTLLISGYYQGLKTKRTNDNGPLGMGFQSASTSIFEGRIDTANAHMTWTPTGINTLTGGYEFERENYENIGTTSSHTSDFSAHAVQRSHTFYVQDLVSLVDGRLQLAGGFRAQRFDLDRPGFSVATSPFARFTFKSPPTAYTFDGAFSYFVAKTGTKLRAHVGNGYHAPSMYERIGSYFFAGSFFPIGNPELRPEKSIGYDGGIEQYFAKQRVRATATYFYTRIKDEITYLPTDDFSAPSYYNFDRHFSRGVEFSGSVKPTGSTDVFVSYTFTNSDVRNFRRPTFPVGPVSSSDRKAYGIPDNQFTLVATQRFKRFWVNFDFLATSDYLAPIFSNSTFNTYIYRFSGNRRGDLTAGYTFGFVKEKMSLRLYGMIENVFDNEYFENGFKTFRRNGRVGLSFGF